jgi:hypothetical protein
LNWVGKYAAAFWSLVKPRSSLHVRVCVWPEHTPPFVVWRCCSPFSHVLLQADQSDHETSRPSQGWVSVVSPHAAPPYRGGYKTVRRRCLVPAPHDVEHAEKVDQALWRQSTGHCLPVSHARWVGAAQALPECCGCCRTIRT